MPRQSYPQVITANDLLEGDVVYIDASGGWTRDLSEALLFEDPTAAQDALAKAQTRPDLIVGIYLADMARGPDGTPQPVHFRERFRATGPSNYAHGKQEALSNV